MAEKVGAGYRGWGGVPILVPSLSIRCGALGMANELLVMRKHTLRGVGKTCVFVYEKFQLF
jgi:hypothetical protein